MKTKIVFFALLPICLLAQPFYLKVTSGYGLGTSPKEFMNRNFTTTTTTLESQSFSFGEGLYFNAALGYNISSNAGVELEFNYTSGAALNLDIYDSSQPNSQVSYKEEQKGTAVTIIPSFVLSGEFGVIKPYLKFGPILGFAGIDDKINGNGTNEGERYTFNIESSYENNFIWGLNAALGLEVKLNEIFAVAVEVINKNLSYSPDKFIVEKYIINGVDRIRELSEAQIEVNYEEKVTSLNSGGDAVSKEPRIELPFSSIVGVVGIRINL
jgi:opacity protein-like surface antigen